MQNGKTVFPSPSQLEIERDRIRQEIQENLLECNQKFILDKLKKSTTNPVVIKPVELTINISLLKDELKNAGYTVSRGWACTCHGDRGIVGPSCDKKRPIIIGWCGKTDASSTPL